MSYLFSCRKKGWRDGTPTNSWASCLELNSYKIVWVGEKGTLWNSLSTTSWNSFHFLDSSLTFSSLFVSIATQKPSHLPLINSLFHSLKWPFKTSLPLCSQNPQSQDFTSSLLLFWENRSYLRYVSFYSLSLPLWIPLYCKLYSSFQSLAPGWNVSHSGNIILFAFTFDHKPSHLLTYLLLQFSSLIFFFLISPDQSSLLPT